MSNIVKIKLIGPTIVMLIGFIIYALISSVSIIYNKVAYNTTFKEWVSDRIYLLLFYLFLYVMMIFMLVVMFFEFLGIFAGILILTTAGGIVTQVKTTVAIT